MTEKQKRLPKELLIQCFYNPETFKKVIDKIKDNFEYKKARNFILDRFLGIETTEL